MHYLGLVAGLVGSCLVNKDLFFFVGKSLPAGTHLLRHVTDAQARCFFQYDY